MDSSRLKVTRKSCSLPEMSVGLLSIREEGLDMAHVGVMMGNSKTFRSLNPEDVRLLHELGSCIHTRFRISETSSV